MSTMRGVIVTTTVNALKPGVDYSAQAGDARRLWLPALARERRRREDARHYLDLIF